MTPTVRSRVQNCNDLDTGLRLPDAFGGVVMSTPSSASAARLVGLEGLRFAAAFAILLNHYQFFFMAGNAAPFTAERQPLFALLKPFYQHGYWGVNLFWCISGFIFAWKYASPIGTRAVSFRRFAVLRFSRLYPLHFVTLLVVAVAQLGFYDRQGAYFIYPINDFRHFVLNLAFAQYWGLQDGMSFNGPSWSISAEILVYGLYFAFCRIVGARPRLAAASAVGVFLIAAALQSRLPLSFPLMFVTSFFFLGVLACQLYQFVTATGRRDRAIVGGAAAGVVAVGSLALVCLGWCPVEQVSLVLFPSLILLFQIAVPGIYPRLNHVLMFLGDLTYASYMIQFPLQLLIVQVAAAAGARIGDLSATPAFLVCWVLSVGALSRLVFVWFERPMQAVLRDALGGRRDRTAVASA